MQAGRVTSIVGFGIMSATVGLAHGATITMQMGGEVTYSRNPALTGIYAGDTWHLTYAFDSGAVDGNSSADYGQYSMDSAYFTVNGQPPSVDQTPYEVFIDNGMWEASTYGVTVFFSPFGGFSGNWPALHVRLRDLDTTLLPDDSLPLSPLPLSEFETITFDIEDMLNGGNLVEGTVTSWTPEPSTLSLLIIGGLAVFRRKA